MFLRQSKKSKVQKTRNKDKITQNNINEVCDNNDVDSKPNDLLTDLDKCVDSLADLKNIIFSTLDSIQRFAEEDDAKYGHLQKFKNTFYLKLDHLLDWFLEIEDLILSSTTDPYYDTLFETNGKSNETSETLTRLVDAFLTQYFSLWDIFIKSVCTFQFPDLNNKIDSLGKFLEYIKGKEIDNRFIKTFSFLVEYKDFFSFVKPYRDYSTHHGKLTIESNRNQSNEEGYSLNSFYMSEISRKPGRNYTKNRMSQYKINIFIRHCLIVQFECFSQILHQVNTNCYSKN